VIVVVVLALFLIWPRRLLREDEEEYNAVLLRHDLRTLMSWPVDAVL